MTHKPPKAGHAPEGRIPIFDHEGNMRGHVTHAATQSTVARFLGRHGAYLGTHAGKKAWKIDPPKPKLPPKPAQPKPEAKPTGGGKSASHTLEISLKAAKGSVNKGGANEGK